MLVQEVLFSLLVYEPELLLAEVLVLRPVPGFCHKAAQRSYGTMLAERLFGTDLLEHLLCVEIGEAVFSFEQQTWLFLWFGDWRKPKELIHVQFLPQCFHQTLYCPRWDSFQLMLDFYMLDVWNASKIGKLCSLVIPERNSHIKDCSCDLI